MRRACRCSESHLAGTCLWIFHRCATAGPIRALVGPVSARICRSRSVPFHGASEHPASRCWSMSQDALAGVTLGLALVVRDGKVSAAKCLAFGLAGLGAVRGGRVQQRLASQACASHPFPQAPAGPLVEVRRRRGGRRALRRPRAWWTRLTRAPPRSCAWSARDRWWGAGSGEGPEEVGDRAPEGHSRS